MDWILVYSPYLHLVSVREHIESSESFVIQGWA
jgi:hypothetical protein